MRAFSPDLRQRILQAARAGTSSQAAVAGRFCVSLRFVEQLLHRYRQTGSLAPEPHRGGRQRVIRLEDEPMLVALLDAHNDATDAEIAARFTATTGRVVSTRTVNRTWHRLGITRKRRRSAPANRTAGTSPPNETPSVS